MSLTLPITTIQLLAGEDDGPPEPSLNDLVSLWIPIFELRIRSESWTDPRAILGMCEVVAGERTGHRLRSPGAADDSVQSGVVVRPFRGEDPLDPFGLAARGWARLESFTVPDPQSPPVPTVSVAWEPEAHQEG